MADNKEASELQQQLCTLQAELKETKNELQAALKKLERTERLYEKANSYNDDLRSQVDSLSKELHEYKSALRNRVEAGVQVDQALLFTEVKDGDPEAMPSWDVQPTDSAQSVLQEGEPMSLADSLKATAEQAMQQTGFVYDETTGLYYDYSSGLYYDADASLYYDNNSGIYYYYDQESQSYQFHSQIDITQYRTQVQDGHTAATIQPASGTQHAGKTVDTTDQGTPSGKSRKKKKERRKSKNKTDSDDTRHKSRKRHKRKKDQVAEKADSKGEKDYKHTRSKRRKKKDREKDDNTSKDAVSKNADHRAQRVNSHRHKERRQKCHRSDDTRLTTEGGDSLYSEVKRKSNSSHRDCKVKVRRHLERNEKGKHVHRNRDFNEDQDLGSDGTQASSDVTNIQMEDKMECESNSDTRGQHHSGEMQKDTVHDVDKVDMFADDSDMDKCSTTLREATTPYELKDCGLSRLQNDQVNMCSGGRTLENDSSVTEANLSQNSINLKCDVHKISESYKESKGQTETPQVGDVGSHRERKYSAMLTGKQIGSQSGKMDKKCLLEEDMESCDKEEESKDIKMDSSDEKVKSGEIITKGSCQVEEESQETKEEEMDLNDGDVAVDDGEMEEGELSDSSGSSFSSTSSSSSSTSSDTEESETGPEADPEPVSEECSASHWPPCIRAMVTESEHLDPGTLFIITCTGATIGREKDMGHLIAVPDLQVSKMHAEIQYDATQRTYTVKDHGSQNGTFLNGMRLSDPKAESLVYPVFHRCTLQVGSTKLELHIHVGTDTCDGCEPGQVQAQLQQKQQKEVVIINKEERERQRKKELKMIKTKYGLANMAYVGNKEALSNPAYSDRATHRRITKGSDNPYQKDDAPSSVDRAISAKNKGHKLLQKMGWSEGESLGKSQQGIAEPIQVKLRSKQSAGLGSGLAYERSLDDAHKKDKTQKWLKTQHRFQQLENADAGSTATAVPSTEQKAKRSGMTQWVQGDIMNPSEDSKETREPT